MLHSIYLWAIAHPTELPLALAAAAAILRALYALVSRLVAPYPRLRALVEAVAAASPDVIRAGQQLASALLGRAVPTLDLRAPDDDRAALLRRAEDAEREVARQRDVIAALRAGAVGVSSPTTAAALDRASVVPPAIAPRTGQSGRATPAALVVACLACLALAAALAGCPRLPERVGCAEGTRACIGDAPHVCDGDGRYHRAGDLACSRVGGVCVASEGRAWCAPITDAGAADASDGGAE